ncbi:hypothetical protein V8C86DRAFT_671367 [Haematococcus lacustris]
MWWLLVHVCRVQLRQTAVCITAPAPHSSLPYQCNLNPLQLVLSSCCQQLLPQRGIGRGTAPAANCDMQLPGADQPPPRHSLCRPTSAGMFCSIWVQGPPSQCRSVAHPHHGAYSAARNSLEAATISWPSMFPSLAIPGYFERCLIFLRLRFSLRIRFFLHCKPGRQNELKASASAAQLAPSTLPWLALFLCTLLRKEGCHKLCGFTMKHEPCTMA